MLKIWKLIQKSLLPFKSFQINSNCDILYRKGHHKDMTFVEKQILNYVHEWEVKEPILHKKCRSRLGFKLSHLIDSCIDKDIKQLIT